MKLIIAFLLGFIGGVAATIYVQPLIPDFGEVKPKPHFRNVRLGMTQEEVLAQEKAYKPDLRSHKKIVYKDLYSKVLGKIRNVNLEYVFADNQLIVACSDLNLTDVKANRSSLRNFRVYSEMITDQLGAPLRVKGMPKEKLSLGAKELEETLTHPYQIEALWKASDHFSMLSLFEFAGGNTPFKFTLCAYVPEALEGFD